MSKILVLGDSHAGVFRRSEFADCGMEVVTAEGATISGFQNPNSKTQALPRFEEAIWKTKARRVITLIGEVDCSFIVWWRAKRHGVTIQEALQEALLQYQRLLLQLYHRFDLVACISAPLPTITDANKGRVAHLRRKVLVSQWDRTALTLAFNANMRAFCARCDIVFVDLDEEMLGEDGLVLPVFLNEDPLDHHYHQERYAQVLYDTLVWALVIGPG